MNMWEAVTSTASHGSDIPEVSLTHSQEEKMCPKCVGGPNQTETISSIPHMNGALQKTLHATSTEALDETDQQIVMKWWITQSITQEPLDLIRF